MIRCRRPIIPASVFVVAALSLIAAGCGGGSSPSAQNTATTAQNGALGFANCMRAHGVPAFPDPDSSGDLPKAQVVVARKSNPSRFDSANNACRNLLPNGPQPQSQPLTAADRTDYLKAAACMRSHGFPDFPDPTFQNNEARVNVPSSINQDAPRFKSAATICTKLIPAGLPYSHPSGS